MFNLIEVFTLLVKDERTGTVLDETNCEKKAKVKDLKQAKEIALSDQEEHANILFSFDDYDDYGNYFKNRRTTDKQSEFLDDLDDNSKRLCSKSDTYIKIGYIIEESDSFIGNWDYFLEEVE